ncbi:CAP domain-containing protein [Streptomyces sp. NPDC048106]|uniref:CAP domain-containing protein n=1 Tax=Streptomyces sp. NPDC048106 TaxID=3155750 RepID=UPI003456D553
MGRHRRSDADRAAEGDPGAATAGSDASPSPSADTVPIPMGTAPYLNPEAYAAAKAKADAYLFAAGPADPASTDPASADPGAGAGAGAAGDPVDRSTWAGDPGEPAAGGQRRQKQAGRAVSMTLLGLSLAVAVGTAAVAAGVVPGFQGYRLDSGTHATGGDRIQVAGSPAGTADAQGGTSGDASGGTSGGTSGGASGAPATGQDPVRSSAPATPTASATASPTGSPSPTPTRSASPTPSKSAKPAAPVPSGKATVARTAPAVPAAPRPKPSPTTAKPSPTPRTTPTRTKAPAPTVPPVTVSAQAAAEAEVLKLVNDERAKAGCTALSANSALTGLAEAFSDDMAARGFFSDTDPDGKSPWDRAAAAGISGLGAENIARGPADPAAVVKAWMDSPEHRANILNCDFGSLGVGVHFGAGGPWWTEEFGD